MFTYRCYIHSRLFNILVYKLFSCTWTNIKCYRETVSCEWLPSYRSNYSPWKCSIESGLCWYIHVSIIPKTNFIIYWIWSIVPRQDNFKFWYKDTIYWSSFSPSMFKYYVGTIKDLFNENKWFCFAYLFDGMLNEVQTNQGK